MRTYEVVRVARGRAEVVDAGPLPKMLAKLRELRQSTRRGAVHRLRGGNFLRRV